MIELGQLGRDIITGFTGICLAKAQYLTGCNQVLLTPTKLSVDDKRREGEWFDDQRIQAVNNEILRLDNRTTNGADEREPPKN